MFSLTEISFNIGLMLGPLVCGSLSDAYGFEYTAWTLGEYHASSNGKDRLADLSISSWRCCIRGMYILHLLHAQVGRT